jgi:putative ABC transport system substrate-binding protein
MTIGIRHQAIGNSRQLQLVGYAHRRVRFALCLPSALRFLLAVACASLLAFATPIQGQQVPGPRIGVLHLGTPKVASVSIEAFQRGLRNLGYMEGKNLVVDYRYAEGKEERYTSLAAELVALRPAVIVTWGTDVTAAVKKTTSTIPVVFALADRPDVLGVVGSLSRPGGNVTGMTTLNFELSTKRLELLKETIPE